MLAIQSPIEADRQGQAVYDERLKPTLEPTHNGEVVAIHLATGDYRLARNGTSARRLLRAEHPEGVVYSLWIGPVSAGEIDFASHLRAARKP